MVDDDLLREIGRTWLTFADPGVIETLRQLERSCEAEADMYRSLGGPERAAEAAADGDALGRLAELTERAFDDDAA